MNEGGIWNWSRKGHYGRIIMLVSKEVRIRRVGRRKSNGNKTGYIPISNSATMNNICKFLNNKRY